MYDSCDVSLGAIGYRLFFTVNRMIFFAIVTSCIEQVKWMHSKDGFTIGL